MICGFCVTEQRTTDDAGYWHHIAPCMHPTRTLDVHDLVFIIQGEWEIGIGEDIYKVKDNDVIILPAGVLHFGVKPCAPNTKYMWVHMHSYPKDKMYETIEEGTDNILVSNPINTAGNPSIKALFEKVLKSREAPYASGAYTTVLLHELSECGASQSRKTLAQSIRSYAISMTKIPTNAEIAEHFYVSKRTAELAFKKQYKTTIHDYILKYKLNEGKRRLREFPDVKLHALAEALGFYDEYHFSRMFKRYFGISPKDFKKIKK